jgi:hypothetical protein
MASLNAWISGMLAAALTGCGGGGADPAAPTVASLEDAARARGLAREPSDAPTTGLFVRGGDRLCLADRGGGVRIGVVSDYSDGIACSATGVASTTRENLSVTLGSRGDCRFDAQYDGVRIVFPAAMPAGCARFCAPRASLSALSVERLSDSIAEAEALRDPRERLLCAD